MDKRSVGIKLVAFYHLITFFFFVSLGGWLFANRNPINADFNESLFDLLLSILLYSIHALAGVLIWRRKYWGRIFSIMISGYTLLFYAQKIATYIYLYCINGKISKTLTQVNIGILIVMILSVVIVFFLTRPKVEDLFK